MECGLRCAGNVDRKAPLDGGNDCCDLQGMLLLEYASESGVVQIETHVEFACI